jgi:hypothetical protein
VSLLIETTGSSSPVTASFLIDSGKAHRLFDFAPMEVLVALGQFVRDNA